MEPNISAKFNDTLKEYKDKSIVICIVGSPDPDVIAGSLALQYYFSAHNINSKIYHDKVISLSNNHRMLNELDIPLHYIKNFKDIPEDEEYDGYAVVDYSKIDIEFKKQLPCIFHVDHHKEQDNNTKPIFQYINKESGSVSSIFAKWMEELDFLEEITDASADKLATALSYGIYSDTDKMTVCYTVDHEAMAYLHKYLDANIFRSISRPTISTTAMNCLVKGLDLQKNNFEKIENFLIIGVGSIKSSQRDVLAILADFFICRESISTALVYGIIESNGQEARIEGCARTFDSGYNLDTFLKELSSDAGGKKHKGAFSIPIGPLSEIPNKEKLWDIVKDYVLVKIKSQIVTEEKPAE